VSGEVFVLYAKVCDNALMVVFRRCWSSIHAVVITDYYALTNGVDTYRATGNQRTGFRVVCPALYSVRIYRITAFYRPRICDLNCSQFCWWRSKYTYESIVVQKTGPIYSRHNVLLICCHG